MFEAAGARLRRGGGTSFLFVGVGWDAYVGMLNGHGQWFAGLSHRISEQSVWSHTMVQRSCCKINSHVFRALAKWPNEAGPSPTQRFYNLADWLRLQVDVYRWLYLLVLRLDILLLVCARGQVWRCSSGECSRWGSTAGEGGGRGKARPRWVRILYLGFSTLTCDVHPSLQTNIGQLGTRKIASGQWDSAPMIGWVKHQLQGCSSESLASGFDKDWFVRFLGDQNARRRSSVSSSNDKDILSFLSWLSLGTLSLLRSVVPMYIIIWWMQGLFIKVCVTFRAQLPASAAGIPNLFLIIHWIGLSARWGPPVMFVGL